MRGTGTRSWREGGSISLSSVLKTSSAVHGGWSKILQPPLARPMPFLPEHLPASCVGWQDMLRAPHPGWGPSSNLIRVTPWLSSCAIGFLLRTSPLCGSAPRPPGLMVPLGSHSLANSVSALCLCCNTHSWAWPLNSGCLIIPLFQNKPEKKISISVVTCI